MKEKNNSKARRIANSIETTILLILCAFVAVRFSAPLWFKNKVTTGNITFYARNLANYGEYEESQKAFNALCQSIGSSAQTNPFFNGKKQIKIFFSDNYVTYFLLNPLAVKSIGGSSAIGNSGLIFFTKSDFIHNTVQGLEKEYNTRNLTDACRHEFTHIYLSKAIPFAHRLTLPAWKEEGIAENIAASSTYDVESGIAKILQGEQDSRKSFSYLKYRIAVLYLRKAEGLDFAAVISDKRKLDTIMEQAKTYNKQQILAWFE